MTFKATREQNKSHNQRLILKTIYDQREISRVDVARQTDLTPTTISSNVGELIEAGLVAEIGVGPSLGGKPPTLLSVVPGARQLVSLDLAHSMLRGALLNLRGEAQDHVEIPLSGRSGLEALDLVYQLADALVARASAPLLGIGIGTPGVIDTPNGVVRQAVNLDWRDVPLRDLLTARYGLPIHIANDSHAAAIAEYSFGSRGESGNLAVIKAGRGIGMGVILGGQLFYGDSGGAGEIGHIVVVEHGALCHCGNFGCLERVASSEAIAAQARTLARTQTASQLHAHPGPIALAQVLEAVGQGDTALLPIVANAGRYLGIAAAFLAGALNINHIVVAGPVARFGAPLLDAMRETVRQRTLATLTAQARIEASALGDQIVQLGAGALVLRHELGVI